MGSFPEVPPCTQVLPTECKRKSLLLLHPPRRSRSLLHQRENTLSGSEVPSLLPSLPSSRCGSLSKNTTRQVPQSSTENASNLFIPVSLFLFSVSSFFSNFLAFLISL